ncbi:MAG: chemotaxis-specific protein-glutamate methyltransferase CheB [Lentisphaeraceae bacterium]|nr:chemotaxis-specific protein-glutamate methyltransferase CheB [Lentisphaeraceae bacterium]
MADLRILICDDSLVYRALLKKLIGALEGVELVPTAKDGRDAILKIEEFKPDLVVLDVEMPVMDGMAVMEELSNHSLRPSVVMCSALTTEGATVTIQALELGAFDFITKPEGKDRKESESMLLSQLRPIVEFVKKTQQKESSGSSTVKAETSVKHKKVSLNLSKPELICIGISTGGPNALSKILPILPADFSLPIAIVQHMPPLFIESLAKSLNDKCSLNVKVAEEGEVLKKGTVYFAPGKLQMGVVKTTLGIVAKLHEAPAENHCLPAADFLFRHAAQELKSAAIGLVMTGMGCDGAKGLKFLHDAGAETLAQDESTCTIYGMPKEAIKEGGVNHILPLPTIVPKLLKLVN